jgi:hypothetical protein
MRNQELHIRANTITQNLLIALWQTASGRTVARIPCPRPSWRRSSRARPLPTRAWLLVASQLHRSLWIRGDSVKRVPTALEATEVYPDMAFQTIEQAFAQFA